MDKITTKIELPATKTLTVGVNRGGWLTSPNDRGSVSTTTAKGHLSRYKVVLAYPGGTPCDSHGAWDTYAKAERYRRSMACRYTAVVEVEPYYYHVPTGTREWA